MPSQSAKSDKSTVATLVQESARPLESLKAIGGAIVAAASFEAASRNLLPTGTWAELLTPLVSASVLLAACLYVIFANRQDSSSVARRTQLKGIHGRRYARPLRTFCKAGAVILLILIGLRLRQILPNAVTGHKYIAGFVCSASGSPVKHGTVEVMGRSDTVISTAQRLDDRGFFYVTLEKWALAPQKLQITATGCGVTQRSALGAAKSGACVSRSEAPDPSIDVQEWVLSCDNK